ncbi:Putative oxidoreductase FAD/NAD(P)-binding, NADH:cytochrome b5 reductase [Septoria linicola]|uniref:NADH-cytochrome b5 reductase 2 n=1 Tax=Septoria linicola TaxID=215465 RepID=A0A9Q9ATW6_9PEZI|nr:Putative oxidoreductase FAD/NAD(P)-binding, NADH:cytochrome b5 reductase [Septoria linicola]
MATVFTRSARLLPYLTGAAALGTAGTVYYTTRRPLLLDSTGNMPSKTLVFPKTMLFSQTLTVTSSEQINHDTKRITFRLPGGDNEISGVPAGAAVLTQHTPQGAWFPVLRPYTPISEAEARGEIQLIVKQYPNGKASTHIHSLAPGQTLQIRGPIPGYSYTASRESRDLLFVAGGAGITPIFSLAQRILNDTNDKTRIQLLWGVNGTRDIVLKNELEHLEKQFPDKLQLTYCVSGAEGRPEAASLGDKTRYKKGYVDKRVLQEVIARTQSLGDAKGTKVFVCGPPALENALTARGGVLAELDIEKKNIHKF